MAADYMTRLKARLRTLQKTRIKTTDNAMSIR
jgi:hypothetical protein